MFFVNTLIIYYILIIFILSKYSDQHICECFYIDNRIYWFIIYRMVLIRLRRMQNSLLLHQRLSIVWNQQLKLLLLVFWFLIAGHTHTAIPKTLKQSLSLSTKNGALWLLLAVKIWSIIIPHNSSQPSLASAANCIGLHNSKAARGSCLICCGTQARPAKWSISL